MTMNTICSNENASWILENVDHMLAPKSHILIFRAVSAQKKTLITWKMENKRRII